MAKCCWFFGNFAKVWVDEVWSVWAKAFTDTIIIAFKLFDVLPNELGLWGLEGVMLLKQVTSRFQIVSSVWDQMGVESLLGRVVAWTGLQCCAWSTHN